MRWQLLLTPPLPGTVNMAIDEALMDRARRTGTGVVRVYSWAVPTVSLGRNQTAIGTLDAGRGVPESLPTVRRLTGGRALVHAREITYAVTGPAGDEHGRETYRAINARLADALHRLGVPVEVATARTRMPAPGGSPCFELPAPGELVIEARKLVGSAQVKDRGAYLQHGSILVHDDQGLLAPLARTPLPLTPAATLAAALGREPSAEEFAALLFASIREAWDRDATSLDPGESLAMAAPYTARYEDDAWTWRR